MKDIKIIVATHKKYKMPEDDMYVPVHVGREGKDDLGYRGDNEGEEHISEKNPYYCELTGLYWAWKNLDADYIGLAHYRRNFISKKGKDKFSCVATKEFIDKKLDEADVILPKRRHLYIETIYSHYKHTMHVEPLDETRKIIEEKCPEYLEFFDKKMKSRSGHMFNMCVMKKEILDEYCEWLFDILFELEKRIDPKQYSAFHARYLGRISERLLDVWIMKNNIKYTEVKVADMQGTNWKKKIWSFLKAKFIGKKYEGSF